jgi:CO/xanthine dehydrogenase FAD-binding subunit
MKPAPFDYIRPKTLAEACAILAGNEDALPIAGGQTLVPMLAMRLARPTLLVDILRLAELHGIERAGDVLVIGAATRQADAEHSRDVALHLPLLAEALPFVGHQPTRNRGTVGGSIANADPSAEIPLVAVTLGATIIVQTPDGEQAIAAADFFQGAMTTALTPGSCVKEVRFPIAPGRRIGVGFHEISARKSDFAYVSAAAQIAFDEAGLCAFAALGLGGVGDTPLRVPLDGWVGRRLDGTAALSAVAADVAAMVADLAVNADIHASAGYRRRLAAALATRALADALDQARGAS